jgi:hypothetical protein
MTLLLSLRWRSELPRQEMRSDRVKVLAAVIANGDRRFVSECRQR